MEEKKVTGEMEEKEESIVIETQDTELDHLPEWYRKPVLILGCGNVLFGDDGFGPAVVEYIQSHSPPPGNVYAITVGTSARTILFPMAIGNDAVETLIIVDAVDFGERGRTPGEIFEIPLEDIPLVKTDDFSMHQVPSSNLLRELRDRRKINVIVLACQIESIPDRVAPGLSEPVRAAIPKMCELLSRYWR